MQPSDLGHKTGSREPADPWTPVALAVRFRAETAQTFGACLRTVRISKAAVLLASSAKSVKEVWAEVGYNYASNFGHEFRKQFGTSPTEYRARSNLQAPPPKTTSHDRRATVLLVDDDEGTRETVGRYLTLEGFSVACAASGRDALARAAQLKPAMVLLDYHLPDIDGLSCLRRLREERSPAELPVVLFTADMELESDDPDVRALGATVASKLCDLEDVLQLVMSASQMRETS
jgi:CheY-like chemotaxis protein